MSNDSDPLFEKFKKLNNAKKIEEQRERLLRTDYPSLFFKRLIELFTERGNKLKESGIVFDFRYFEDIDQYYTHEAFRARREYRDRDERYYDSSFDQFPVDKMIDEHYDGDYEKYEAEKLYYEKYGYPDEAEKLYYEKYGYPDEYEEDEVLVKYIGRMNLECSNYIFEISFEHLNVVFCVDQRGGETMYRYINVTERDEYLDIDEATNKNMNLSEYELVQETITLKPYLYIRYFNNSDCEFEKQDSYLINVNEELNALWGNETDYSLSNTVFSWFLEQYEK